MTWVTYLKSSVEIVLIIFLGCLMIYLFKSQPLSHAIGISVFLVILFIVLDGFLLRGTFFKIKEGFDETKLTDLSEKEQKIQRILKGYGNTGLELKIKNLKVNGEINGLGFYEIFDTLYPIGTILMTKDNPQNTLKFGEWSKLSSDNVRFLRIKKPGDKNVDKDVDNFVTVDLQESQIPFHDHDIFDSQTVSKRSYHKVFIGGKAKNKLYVCSITKSEAENSGDSTFKSLKDQFADSTPHNNISPFVSFNIWERVK